MLQFDETAMLASMSANSGVLQYKTDVVAWFTTHATKDEIATHREGRPIYVESVLFGRKARDTKDYITSPATPEDIEAYPAEWAAYQDTKRNAKTSLRCLPGMTMAAFLTLQEIKIGSIEDFAAMKAVFPELQSLHAVAVRWVGETTGRVEARKGGWPKGKSRKPREDAQAAA